MSQQSRKKHTTTFSLALFALALVLTSATQGLLSGIPTAEAATHIVTPGSLSDWQFQTDGTASGNLMNGPATPPMGSGSVRLAPGSDGNSGAQFRNAGFNNTMLTSITSMRYSTYVTTNVNCQAPYLILNIDQDNNGSVDDLLFFEPCYQNGTYGTVSGATIPTQPNVALNTWQQWNAQTGGWWSQDAATFGPPLTTLARYAQQFPNARIVNAGSGLGAIRIVAGFGAPAWSNFVGYADAFAIGVNNTEHVYDFEAQGTGSSSSSSSVTTSSSSSTTTSSSLSSSSSSSVVACDAYADSAGTFNQGNKKNGTDVAANRSNTAKALGSPTTGSAPRFLSLGFSGSIVLNFTNYILNGTGADVRIYESSLAQNYPLERARVEASQNGTGWTVIGFADTSDNCNCEQNTTDLDLGSLAWARYIRITDMSNPALHSATADAFDVNAVQALHNSCTAPGSSSSSSSLSSSSMSSSVSSSSSLSSTSSSLSSTSSSSTTTSSSSSTIAGVPMCNGMAATVYVNSNNRVVGGADDGEMYDGNLRGTQRDDVIVGTSGNDDIYGRSGNDTICGGAGDDEIDGGNGLDKLAGEAGRDELDGGNSTDLLCGGEGNDILDAGNSQDNLDGGAGTDDLDGGTSQDVCRNGENNEDCETSGAGNIAQCANLVTSGTAAVSSSSVSMTSSNSSLSTASSLSSVSSLSSSSLSSIPQ